MTHYVRSVGQNTMTPLEAADFLGVSRNGVMTFLKDGRLKGAKNEKDEWEITLASLNHLKNTGAYRKFKPRQKDSMEVKVATPAPVKNNSEVLVEGDFVELRLKIKRDKYELLKLALARKEKNPSAWLLDYIEKTYNDVIEALGMTNL